MPMDIPFEVIYNAVMDVIYRLIAGARGSCVTFTVGQLCKWAGLRHDPITCTVIRHILNDLMQKGLIQVCWKNRKYTRFIVTKDSELWKKVKGLTTENLQH